MYHKLYIPYRIEKNRLVDSFYTANQIFFSELIDAIETKTNHKIEHNDIKQGINMFLISLGNTKEPDNTEPYDGYKNYYLKEKPTQ